MRIQSRHSGYNRCATAAELHRTSPAFEPRNHILWLLRRRILYVVYFVHTWQQAYFPKAANLAYDELDIFLLIIHYQ